jgi:aminoglycoside 2''-phosphotransferase
LTSRSHIEEYVEAIKRELGDNASIEHVQSGYVNSVFLVNNTHVFRFPKSDEVLHHQWFEREICTFLSTRASDLQLRIPKPLDVILDPPCFVYTFIPGKTISEEKLVSFTDEKLKNFADDMTSFIYWLGNSVSPEQYDELAQKSTGEPTESWSEYINRTVAVFDNPKYSQVIELCKTLLEQLNEFYPEGLNKTDSRVIHDDLHVGNLLFDEYDRLNGVIDFGGTLIGDLACEFRHFYRLSPDLARAACDIYLQKYGEQVDFTKVEFWAKLTETVVLCAKIMDGKFDSPSLIRAKKNLAKWYPGYDWSI